MFTKCIVNRSETTSTISNAFITVKSRFCVACISPANHNLGLKTGAIVFYDLTLGYGLLFYNFFGIELIIDFALIVAREKWMILDDRGFLVRIEFSTKVFLSSNES